MNGEDTRAERKRIMRQYARMRMGRPVFCGPSKREKEGRPVDFVIVRNGKVIFDDRAQAEAAATALFELTGERFRPYECPRSRHGHHHLTHDRSPATRRAKKGER